VKAILKPKPLDEIRDPKDRFDNVKEVSAAIGVKLLCQSIEALSPEGSQRIVQRQRGLGRSDERAKVNIDIVDAGVYIKADAIGSWRRGVRVQEREIPIRKYDTGSISHKDIIDAAAYGVPQHRVILGST